MHRIDQSEIDRSWLSNHQSWIVFFVLFRLSMIRNHESDSWISSNRQIEWYNWFHRIQMEQSLKRIIVSIMYCNWNYRFMISLCLMLHYLQSMFVLHCITILFHSIIQSIDHINISQCRISICLSQYNSIAIMRTIPIMLWIFR